MKGRSVRLQAPKLATCLSLIYLLRFLACKCNILLKHNETQKLNSFHFLETPSMDLFVWVNS
jgi:hypothetical protein